MTIRELKAYLNMLPETALDGKIIVNTETSTSSSFLPIADKFITLEDYHIGIDGIMADCVFQEVKADPEYEHIDTYDLLAEKGSLVLFACHGNRNSCELKAPF